MMYKKRSPMSFEQATEITNDLLDVFQLIFAITPLKLSTLVRNGKTKIKTFTVFPDKIFHNYNFPFRRPNNSPKVKRSSTDDYQLDIIYKVVIGHRHFEITLFDDPDDLGYCSILPNFDPFTYVVCDIVEKRTNGNKKYEMIFGFDIEKGTFLELFELVHHNAVGIIREYPNLNCPLEAELKDVILL